MNDIDSLKTVIVAIHNMTQSFIDNIYSNIDVLIFTEKNSQLQLSPPKNNHTYS
jgi:hypothetical protein